MSLFQDYLAKVREQSGFIAALDQSGGSTPKALKAYGVDEGAYSSEEEMFEVIHAMRARIMTCSSFDGRRILGAILFEDTMNKMVEGLPTPRYLWERKNVVPFLKIDRGLAEEQNGVQLMKLIPALASTLQDAREKGIFGTKMRSVIKLANRVGIDAVVKQQFEIAKQITAEGLVPIIEPEVDILNPEKSSAESLLKEELLKQLNQLNPEQLVMLKLSLPTQANFYHELIEHPNVVRVVALSGGYSRQEANEKLSQNKGMIASFSRALTEDLRAGQSDEQFAAKLDQTIEGIYQASCA